MPDPVTHTTVGIALGSASAGVLGATLGLDPMSLFAALFGAVVYRTISPPINDLKQIIKSAGFTVAATIIGAYGAMFFEIVLVTEFPMFKPLGHLAFIMPLGFCLGLLGEIIASRMMLFAQNIKTNWEK